MSATSEDTFPRRYARTQRFTLGAPRSFSVAPDGTRVVFVRSRGGENPVGCLWVLDLATSEEQCVADPQALGADDAQLPPEERARRERARESAGGIVTYTTDQAVAAAVFTVGAQTFHVDLTTAAITPLEIPAGTVGARIDPTGSRVAYVLDGNLWVYELTTGGARQLAGDEQETVTWGLAEFIAGEEMSRYRGFWWSPEGDRLAVARVDESPVQVWYLSDPTDPAKPPVAHRYPAAGTPNADVSLHLVTLDGDTTPVSWDRQALPYLVDVTWAAGRPPLVTVQSRDQQHLVVLSVDDAGGISLAREERQTPWVELIDGFPRLTPDGKIIHPITEPDTRRIGIDEEPLTPAGLQVRRLVNASADRLVFTASGDDPTAVVVWQCRPDGTELQALSDAEGVADAVAAGDVTVVIQRRLEQPGSTATVVRPGSEPVAIPSHAAEPELKLNAHPLTLGARQLRGMLLLPEGHGLDDGPLPVLLDPYGGPHAQRVLRSYNAHLSSQWFANQGFAVLVVDGRGSPGRSPAWEHEIAGDLATAPLEDQIDALHACAERHPGLLDLDRVAIKGWSFGGFLAGLAILRRPDVFHAAIAGAPVTDQRLYDTHYTERYLGDPNVQPEVYRASSLIDDAHKLDRPLLLIHGLADDNVVSAHTLQLSRALLEAGRPHSVLPLSGVTHMTPQEVVAENLMRLQLAFLRESLG